MPWNAQIHHEIANALWDDVIPTHRRVSSLNVLFELLIAML